MATNRYMIVIRAPETNPYKWAIIFPPPKNAKMYIRAITSRSTKENAASMVFLLLRFEITEINARMISIAFRAAPIIELPDPSRNSPKCCIEIR